MSRPDHVGASTLRRKSKQHVKRIPMNRWQKVRRHLRHLPRTVFALPGGRDLLAFCLTSYIRFVMLTSHVVREVPESAEPYLRGELPAVFAFWHSRMCLMPYFRPPIRPMKVMISIHRDGAWIATAMEQFGFTNVRGSSNEGGFFAVREGVEMVKQGCNLAVTPDGPRGPAEIARGGSVVIASMADVPVLPVSLSAVRCRHARSWDKLMIPLPFTRVFFVAGEPLRLPAGGRAEAIEEGRGLLTDSLRQVTRRADALAAEARPV